MGDLVSPAKTAQVNGHDEPPVSAKTTSKPEFPWLNEAACYSCMMAAGWSDASSGPLIPYIQAYYSINYTSPCCLLASRLSSTVHSVKSASDTHSVHAGQMCGFLTASFANTLASERFGLGKVIAAGGFIQACGYVFLIPAFPFPIMPICYAIVGFGMALQDAQANAYVAILPRADYKMGFLHAAYGVGALVCPLAATAFASSGLLFAHFYAISLAIASLNTAVLLYAFKFKYRIDIVEPAPMTDIEASSGDEIELDEMATTNRTSSRTSVNGINGYLASETDGKNVEGVNGHGKADVVAPIDVATSARADAPRPVLDTSSLVRRRQNKKTGQNRAPKSTLRRTLTSRTVWVCAWFILVYVGSEVSIGGWIITFLIENRDGGASAGYVATGFWAGLTLGRAISTPLNNWVGEKRILYIYLGIAIGLELAIWFADSLVGNAVTVGLVGLIIGPIYPVTMSVCTKVLPRSMHASGIGFIAAFGSALFPFITGALAQKFSPAVLQPVMVVLFSVQIGIWVFCPSPPRKKD
ncbi:hypothetical protein OIO90_005603 [Microbotryomycetes sp. JL221]|nr:hypothetical protein OIO90_005603 [Microbotryomycetes sp. JL221]